MTADPDLDTIATRLYALPPAAFTTARDEAVRQARAEKRPALARDLARLRRPTQSAWMVNLLVLRDRQAVEEFLALADGLARAQAEAEGPGLLRLDAARRRLQDGLVHAAGTHAAAAGVEPTAAMEREVYETLSAALALPDVAAELRTARLVKPVSYAGFGVLPLAAPPPRPPAPKPQTPVLPEKTPAGPSPSDSEAARRRAARADAERRAAAAAAELALQEHTLQENLQRQEHLRTRIAALEAELHQLREELGTAGQEGRRAERLRDRLRRTHAAAQEEVERAGRA